MNASPLPPLRNLADIEAIERTPLEDRLFSRDVNAWIRRGLDLAPQKIAIHYIPNGNPGRIPASMTYGELKRASIQTANLFHLLGVGPRDAVLILLPTIPLLYPAILGAISTGIVCCVNWMAEPQAWIEPIIQSRAKVVVALGPTPGFDIWEKLQTIRTNLPASVRILSVPGPDGERILESDLETCAGQQRSAGPSFERRAEANDVAAYLQSGGTTGAPKLVRLTHGGFTYKLWANTLVMDYRADDVALAEFPMFHVAGFFSKGLMAIADGMSLVIPSATGARDKRFIENYWKFVERFRITLLSGVPTTLAQLVNHPPRGKDISSLRPHAVTGSTAFPAEIARALEALTGVRVLGTYGATEYTQNVAQAPRDGDPKYGSSGLRLPYTQIRVVVMDGDGRIARPCATDEIGTVLVKGPSVTPGYVDARYNAGIFIPDGWCDSGDLGRIDADGYLWITGRLKDVIIRGGHNIDAATIEEALLQHPDVLLAATVGKPDAHAGELPVAYVELVRGAQADAAELLQFAQAHITERAAVPKDVVILDNMPLTEVGKPAKAALRLNAAQRAFSVVLADVPATVDVVADRTKGTMVVVKISDGAAPDHSAVEAHIYDRMKYFSIPYVIRWRA